MMCALLNSGLFFVCLDQWLNKRVAVLLVFGNTVLEPSRDGINKPLISNVSLWMVHCCRKVFDSKSAHIIAKSLPTNPVLLSVR